MRNARLLHPPLGDIPPLTGSLSQSRVVESAQALELSRELREWITSGKGPQGAVSMLNLLAFLPGKKEEYLKYGQAFAESVGSRRGGVAKIVGKVVPDSCSDGCWGWEEIAVAHYPSMEHFAHMIASDDYQDANKKWRLPSMKDTLIVCTTEVNFDKSMTKASL
ncbi:allantoate permease [Physcia stellaris]|nr:allantoate permease [Physcia stellaris]